MILLSNLTTQTLQPGQSLTFNRIIRKSGRCECFNTQVPTSVKLNANGDYDISFSGNITSVAAGNSVQIAVAVAGQPLVETAMNATPATNGTLVNVSTFTSYRVCCCDLNRISIVNTGTTPVTIAQNSAFLIRRTA